MIDRRRAPRFAAGLEAFIRVPLRSRLPALVTDISTHGAMVEFDHFEYVPSSFQITIGAYTTKCFIRHRDGFKVGVEFETAYDWSHEGAPHFAAVLSPGQTLAWQPRI
jgi:hypothetical protein